MDVLWAGWRATYMQGVQAGPTGTGCLFCELPSGTDEDTYILERHSHAYSVLNLYPYTSGHLIVTPTRHVEEMADLQPSEVEAVWLLLGRSQAALESVLGPHGYNLGANLGRHGGAGVLGHFHMHLVPRWQGDANFMTTTANARILPEALADTWSRLRAELAQ